MAKTKAAEKLQEMARDARRATRQVKRIPPPSRRGAQGGGLDAKAIERELTRSGRLD